MGIGLTDLDTKYFPIPTDHNVRVFSVVTLLFRLARVNFEKYYTYSCTDTLDIYICNMYI